MLKYVNYVLVLVLVRAIVVFSIC